MSSLTKLLKAAQKEFGVGSREHRLRIENPFYIEFPARKSTDKLLLERYAGDAPKLFSPLAYISGIESPGDSGFRQIVRQAPSFTFIVGEYGLGKTEMMYRLVERLTGHRRIPGIDCLPIRLGSCAGKVDVLTSAVPSEEFLLALLDHVVRDRFEKNEQLAGQLLKKIQIGEVVLILDALDELVFELREHKGFLDNVGRLARGMSRYSFFHVLLSVRLEHLIHVSGEDNLDETTGYVQGGKKKDDFSVPIDYLVLDFFDDATVSDYILQRTGDAELVEGLTPHRKLRDMLRRPLLARIFCDLALELKAKGDSASTALLADLERLGSAAGLIGRFTDLAREDKILQAETEKLLPASSPRKRYFWSNERLAKATLNAYRHSRPTLDPEEIASALATSESERATIERLGPVQLEKRIHKVPFVRFCAHEKSLRKGGRRVLIAAFTHRIFYEYFVTRGIVDELAAHLDNERGAALSSFHDLVLNVDMHRFLRYLTIERLGVATWYKETGRAYGLEADCADEWPSQSYLAEHRDRLDAIRKVLLDARSGVYEEPDEEIRAAKLGEAVEAFLELDVSHQLPPRYLVPNYEALAVCLMNPRIRTAERIADFAGLLEKRLLDAIGYLRSRRAGRLSPEKLEPPELLVERILDIARRFHFSWAKRWSSADLIAAPAPGGDLPNSNFIVIRSTKGGYQRVLGILEEIAD